MSASSYETALFDLDGTLIDSIELILASHRHATSSVLGQSPADDVLRQGIGRPLRIVMHELDADRAEALYLAYRSYNDEHHDALVTPYGGMLELLGELRSRGVAVGCVTSKARDTVRRAFALMPLEALLDVVVTSDDTTRHKPDGEPIERALALLGRPAATACYVGDAPSDIESARSAGVHAIAVTWGAFDEAAMRATQPDAIASTIAELSAILSSDG